MFLLHRRLSGVDCFADAAQLRGEEIEILDFLLVTSTPTKAFAELTTETPPTVRNEKLNKCQRSNK